MRLEKQKLNDGSYAYFVGIDRVDCADELGTEKTTVYVYSEYYQFRHRPTRIFFSTTPHQERSSTNGDIKLVKTVLMWKKGINIFCNDRI